MLNIQVQQLQGVALRSKTLCFVVCFVGQNEFPPIGKGSVRKLEGGLGQPHVFFFDFEVHIYLPRGLLILVSSVSSGSQI